MVGEVQTDGDKFPRTSHRRAVPRRALDDGQGGGIKVGQGGQGCRRQLVRTDVWNVGGQIANDAAFIKQARSFLAHGPVTQQFHGRLPLSFDL
ncbi:hypothetical protein D3C73_1335460 [compost metagenome]